MQRDDLLERLEKIMADLFYTHVKNRVGKTSVNMTQGMWVICGDCKVQMTEVSPCKHQCKNSKCTRGMKRVKVGDRIGMTTSVICHRNHKYPVWFNNFLNVEFIEGSQVEFI